MRLLGRVVGSCEGLESREDVVHLRAPERSATLEQPARRSRRRGLRWGQEPDIEVF